MQYRLEWEYDRLETGFAIADDGLEQITYAEIGRGRKVRFIANAATAYRMAALRLIMCRRDKYAQGVDESRSRIRPTDCALCETDHRYLGHGEYADPMPCKYHGGDGFDELVRRLARWLRWRDDRIAALEAEQAGEGTDG
ncbi:MAG TPA: hypothetical protein VGK73_19175 [Polyangiaceae bacterium]